MPGPAPDLNALRRDRPSDQATWTHLPERRDGEPPQWPLTRPTAREIALWSELWTLPQAVMWEAQHSEHTVAAYVRSLRKAESAAGRASDWSNVSRYQRSLGLDAVGLRTNRWIIGDGKTAPAVKTGANDNPARQSARERFTTIEGGASRAS